MNYYEARKRKDGKWDWTGENDGRIFPAGPCVDHDDGHLTREDAERHHYNDLVANLETKNLVDQKLRCKFPDCKEFGDKTLGPRNGSPRCFCDAHFSKESYKKITPFEPGIMIMSSW